VTAAILSVGCQRSASAPALEVDRLEGNAAVVVDPRTGNSSAVPASALPAGVLEGDVLEGGAVNPAATEALRGEVSRARATLRRGTLEIEPARSGSGRTSAAPGAGPSRRARRLTVRREP
jgi:hypothetical protein